MRPDHYATLGVDPDAKPAEIRAAYLALLRTYHPDRNPSPEAAERTQAIIAAFKLLNDFDQRNYYDWDRRRDREAAAEEQAQRGRRRVRHMGLAAGGIGLAAAGALLLMPGSAGGTKGISADDRRARRRNIAAKGDAGPDRGAPRSSDSQRATGPSRPDSVGSAQGRTDQGGAKRGAASTKGHPQAPSAGGRIEAHPEARDGNCKTAIGSCRRQIFTAGPFGRPIRAAGQGNRQARAQRKPAACALNDRPRFARPVRDEFLWPVVALWRCAQARGAGTDPGKLRRAARGMHRRHLPAKRLPRPDARRFVDRRDRQA